MSTQTSPLRWAISEAERLMRYLASETKVPVTADWEGSLRHAHLSADEAEECKLRHETLVNEHLALRLALRTLLASAETIVGCASACHQARQILANLSTP